ncbi:hypothetical protein GCM10010305_14840 [Streptomyces termitum]|uniref:Secreted protein n=1 Tax=Streptomyces termitum TaxID=67368 RepID=A0A918W7A6_9ACTN|nr:hypothetical protein GCM10010305_14840 [Streptomyces termitum]
MVRGKKWAAVGALSLALGAFPVGAGTAVADTPTASCSKEKVNGYTGRASCTSLGGYKKYRVVVPCIANSGRTFEVFGPWISSGWSTASCSGNGSAGVYGYIDVELSS